MKEALAFALLVVMTAIATVGVPAESWRTSPLDPTHLATLTAIAVVLTLLVLRWRGGRPGRERAITAAFLAGMPVVYVASWAWTQPHDGAGWLALEGVGLVAYGALAMLGMRRSPWFLAIGIAGHGIAWDAWHHAHATYIPHWYATGCAIVDIAYAVYVVACVPRWTAHAAARRARAVGVPFGAVGS